jgi:hypothetical protein
MSTVISCRRAKHNKEGRGSVRYVSQRVSESL